MLNCKVAEFIVWEGVAIEVFAHDVLGQKKLVYLGEKRGALVFLVYMGWGRVVVFVYFAYSCVLGEI